MPANNLLPEPWFSFLSELDRAVDVEVRLDCMGGFVVTMVYGFSRPTADLDVFEIAPSEAGAQIRALGMQGGPLHKKYKIYLDQVGVVHVPENYEDRLREIFPRLSICVSAPSIPTTWLSRSWNEIFNGTAMM